MPNLITIVTRSTIEDYARGHARGQRDEAIEAVIAEDPLAGKIFDEARAAYLKQAPPCRPH